MIQKAFEKWVKRTWHESWRTMLTKNNRGAYESFDIQQSWFAFEAGWRSKANRGTVK
jgi:hypothetical protein